MKNSDSQWDWFRHHLPEENAPGERPGSKPVLTNWVFDAVLWGLKTLAQRCMFPPSHPNHNAMHHRDASSVSGKEAHCQIPLGMVDELQGQDLLDAPECYVSATFANERGCSPEAGKMCMICVATSGSGLRDGSLPG